MNNKRTPIIRFILIAILSGLLAYLGQPFVHGNEKAVDLVINVFAILAGFLLNFPVSIDCLIFFRYNLAVFYFYKQ